jgi:hypothetical protein
LPAIEHRTRICIRERELKTNPDGHRALHTRIANLVRIEVMKAIDHLKNMAIQVTNMKMRTIQFGLIVNPIRMKSMKVICA